MLKLDTIRNSCGFCEVYITGDVPLVPGDIVLSNNDGESELFVRATNIEGIFQYGSKQLIDEYFGHKAGYIWSSRVGCINKVFDIATIECCYKSPEDHSYRLCAIDLAHLAPILEGTEYEINYVPTYYFEDKEPYYTVKKI